MYPRVMTFHIYMCLKAVTSVLVSFCNHRFIIICWISFNLGAVFTSGQRFQTKDQQLIDSLQQYEFVQPKLSDASIDQDNNEEHLVSFRAQVQHYFESRLYEEHLV